MQDLDKMVMTSTFNSAVGRSSSKPKRTASEAVTHSAAKLNPKEGLNGKLKRAKLGARGSSHKSARN